MAFPQPKPADGKIIIYPPGVKEITDKISNDELVKRLKVWSDVYVFIKKKMFVDCLSKDASVTEHGKC